MLIVVCGMHRSGSTLQYQIAAELCESQGPLTRHDSWKTVSPETSHDPVNRHIVKVHWPARVLERKLNSENVRYIYSYRDVRDVLASFIGKGVELPPNKAQETIEQELAAFQVFTNRKHVLITKYEEFVGDVPGLIDTIGRFLSIDVSRELRRDLANRLHVDRQRAEVERLMKQNDAKILSETSRLTRHHVGDARIGKWRDVLPEDVQQMSCRVAANWLAQQGYA